MIRTTVLAAAVAASVLPGSFAFAEDGDRQLVAARQDAAGAAAPEPSTGALPSEADATSRKGRRAAAAVNSSAFRALIAKHAGENSVPFGLADAVVRIESRYNARARNGPNVGLTQINARTAQALGYRGGAAGLYDPDTNLRYGIRYLAQAYRLAGGETCGTVLRYQAGHGARRMTNAARAYCARVKTHLAELR
ncbi:lytic transglycosylase domain-containing protein [Chelatococcus sp. SYSU_G07232]|uniref:Lytic transglycosylase domain-containing protein n=1 Tax=Chelatococcus albus TaxID=3047466 RepID=A0ABT7AGW8_9HYPH|nr:lytic transglycosylase domain-containing protein [Chelatococcus sp. SYSU_G07232]MDJ1158622.1 lytic transglycosylase domain-containing protein [Chelatococcus sp. SYSU_G07232]